MDFSKFLLALRMVIYTFAVPVAAYLGGVYDADTGLLTVDLNKTIDIVLGVLGVGATYGVGRISKANGGAT